MSHRRYNTCACGRRKSEDAKMCIACYGKTQRGEGNNAYRGGRSQHPYLYKKETVARHPSHNTARLHVRRALQSGKLVKRLTCEAPGCGCTKVEAHHEYGYDQDNELRVYWLGAPVGKGGCGHHLVADRWGIDALYL